MLKWFEFLKNFPFGIFIGFIAAMGLFWFLGADLSDDLTKYGTYILTAMASLLASAAAFATAIWNSEQQREAQLKAARANLPLALSELVTVSRFGFNYAQETEGWDNSAENFPNLETDTKIPPHTLKTIEAVISSADPITSEWLTLFLNYYQVNTSRLLGRKEDYKNLGFTENCIENSAEWLVQLSIVNHLFDYARTGRQPSKQITQAKPTVPLELKHTALGKQIASNLNRWERITNNYEQSGLKLL
jgi:hypothetical protein